jgi:hypothetical protein
MPLFDESKTGSSASTARKSALTAPPPPPPPPPSFPTPPVKGEFGESSTSGREALTSPITTPTVGFESDTIKITTPPPPQGYQDPDVAGTRDDSSEMLADLSSAQLTANPLPSMPSISNVGAVPFSGSINWNAIPGGFQPGRRKRLYQLSQFHGGINQKSSPRDISDQECQEATNVTVSQIGRIRLLGDLNPISGVHDGGDGQAAMTDASATFIIDDLIGSTIFNTTDGSSGLITDNTATVVTATLAGGTDNDWDDDDVFEINSTGLITDVLAAGGATHIPSPGYGLFVFKSGYSLEATPTQGDYTIVAATDGANVRLKDSTTATGDLLDISTTGTSNQHVAPVFYAAGNGLYACNADLESTETRKAHILVYRKDINRTITVTGWSSGEALISSPIRSAAAAANTVNLATSHIDAAQNGQMSVTIINTGSGNWGTSGGLVYYFYVSYLFDNGCETGLTSIGTDTFTDEKCDFNISIKHSNSNPLGGNKRIHGARIYFRKTGTVERFMLAEVSLPDGIKGVLDTTFTPWDVAAAGIYDLAANITFESPPSLYIYSDLNIYYANEMYDESLDNGFTDATCDYNNDPTIDHDDDSGRIKVNMMVDGTGIPDGAYVASVTSDTSFELSVSTTTGSVTNGTLTFYSTPQPHEVRYRTATVGANGIVFIGCYAFRNKVFADGMMYSMANKPGVFPEYNVIDSPSSDGTPITVLMSFQDKILQFKQDALYIMNISNPSQYYTEASFRNCGIMNPCQAFHTPFGIIFVNYIGCFIYDGRKVISLTSGKFTIANWGISEGSVVDTSGNAAKDAINVPCIGYDPRSQSIIVLKNIGDNSTDTGAWIYHMETQSWVEATSFITNGSADRHTNFIISPSGHLTIGRDARAVLYNFKDVSLQTITYWTKDLDFGLPSQTKYLYKVYITYKGDADALTVAYGVDGETDTSDLYHFSKASWGGTTDTTPLLDKNSTADLESWHVAELYPDDAGDGTDAGTEGKGWKSISIYMNGEVDSTFEINDISILYRPRPIK